MISERPIIKICCISSIEEARTAIAAGAGAIGLVGRMPSGPGVISDDRIEVIAQSVPRSVGTFLLTSETTAEGIVGHQRRVGTNTVQIVDALSEGSHQEIRAALPGVTIVQVVHVIDERSVDEAVEAAVDAILLDSGNPNLPVKELGGTGRVHDWKLSRSIVEKCGKPVFLAGGIGAGNVREAWEKVRPHGFDLCTSVRTDGRLDRVKLERFFEAVDECV